MDLEELMLDSNLSQDSKQKRVLELKNLSDVILEQRKKRGIYRAATLLSYSSPLASRAEPRIVDRPGKKYTGRATIVHNVANKF